MDYDEARGILKEMNEEFKNILIDRFESWDFKNQEKLSSGKVWFSINTSKGKSSEYYAKIQEYLKEKWYYDFSEMDWDQVKNLKFIDMCAGPHIDNSDEIDANSFKLAKIAWAYWLWDAENQQLTRIYAYAFDTALELEKMIVSAGEVGHSIIISPKDLANFVKASFVDILEESNSWNYILSAMVAQSGI